MKKKGIVALIIIGVLIVAGSAVAFASISKKCEHKNTHEVINVKSTCTTQGSAQVICSDCNSFIRTKTLELAEHAVYEEYHSPATCEQSGYKRYKCANCTNYDENKPIDPIPHEYEQDFCSMCGANEAGEKLSYSFTTLKGVQGCVITAFPLQVESAVIPSVYMGKPVVKLGDYIFENNTAVKFVTIPKTVIEITDDTFDGSTIKEITFESGGCLETIKERTFENLSSLTAVNNIPATVTKIEKNAFKYCENLKTVSFENGSQLKTIESSAFEYCRALEKIAIPDSVTEIQLLAFNYCNSLTEINIPASLETSKSPFQYCNRLRSITIPAGLTVEKLSDRNLFSYCTIWEIVNLSDISNDFFTKDSTTVRSFTNDESKIVEDNGLIFLPTANGTYLIGNNNNQVENLVLPNGFNGENYAIGDYAFYDCSKILSITIPEKVNAVGDNAFCDTGKTLEVINLSSLTNLNIPNALFVSKSTFATENDFSYITVNGVKTLINYSGNATNLVLPETLGGEAYALGKGVFANVNLKSLTLPESLLGVNENIFGTKLDTAPYYNRKDNGFYIGTATNPYALLVFISGEIGYSFVMQESTKFVCSDALCNDNFVREIILNEQVKGELSFNNCARLEKIVLSNGISKLLPNAFSESYAIKEITVGTGLKEIFNLPDNTVKLKLSSLESWLNIDFYNYTGGNKEIYLNGEPLNQLIIPENVTEIKDFALYGWTVTKIQLHNGVIKVGEGNFSSSNLTEIVLGTGLTQLNSTISDNVTKITIGSLENWLNYDLKYSIYYADFYLNGTKLTNIVIPNGITEIKPYAFANWLTIDSLTIPDSVTTIGESAIANAYIKQIIGGKGVTVNKSLFNMDIVESHVYGNVNYKLNVPVSPVSENITWARLKPNSQAKNYLFQNCSKLTHVYIGSGSKLGSKAFFGTNSAIRVIFEDKKYDSATSDWRIVGGTSSQDFLLGGFYNVNGTTVQFGKEFYDVNIENGFAYSVEGNANENGKAVIEGYFGDNTVVNIPETLGGLTVKSINENALYNRDGITEINLSANVTRIGELACYGLTSLESVYLNNVEEIEMGAFAECANLSNATFNQSAQNKLYIRQNVFQNCSSIKEITLGNNLETIYITAFIGCTGLEKVIYNGSHDSWHSVGDLDSDGFIDDVIAEFTLNTNENLLDKEIFIISGTENGADMNTLLAKK